MKASYRDQRERVNQALRDQERLYGDLRAAKGIPAPIIEDLPPKRQIVNRTDPAELEGSVKREVGRLLSAHPKVLYAERRNSGALLNSSGAPVQFHIVIRAPAPIRVADFTGFLKSGRSFAFECKRRSFVSDPKKWNVHEQEQARYLLMIQDCGGVAGFVTCAEDALRLLEGI